MTMNQFSREMSRRPFRPFSMVLVDGRTFTVDHPEFALIDRRGREVTLVAADNTRHEIDTRLITEIVATMEQQPAATRDPNGED